MPAVDLGPISLFFEDIRGGGNPPLLLIHELGGSSASWHTVIPRLAPHRRIIAPDLRGAGRNENPCPAPAAEDATSPIAISFPTVSLLLGARIGG